MSKPKSSPTNSHNTTQTSVFSEPCVFKLVDIVNRKCLLGRIVLLSLTRDLQCFHQGFVHLAHRFLSLRS